MATAIFSFDDKIIKFSSNEPGSHVALTRGNLDLEFIGGDFDDEARSYTWKFALNDLPLKSGEKVVFRTSDRGIVEGVIDNGSIKVIDGTKDYAVRRFDLVYAKEFYRLPKVSIVTCSYNRPDLLRAAVESLRKQTDSDWEHLICDDESDDREVDRVLAWAAEDPRVRIWRSTKNFDRPSALWNFLLDRARGRYFTILDDDNEKLPQFVKIMTGELDANPTLDLVTCGFIVRRDGEPDWEHHYNLRVTSEALDRESLCEGGTVVFRRDVFERAGYFSEAIRTNEDWDWLRRAVRVSRAKHLPECHTVYRIHDANRQRRAEALGHSSDVILLRRKSFDPTCRVRVVRPSPDTLTRSQVDAVRGIERAFSAIPWVVPCFDSESADIVAIVAPFRVPLNEVERVSRGAAKVITIHMEDPYAVVANIERIHCAMRGASEVWVSSNDAAVAHRYRDVVGDRVVVCPSIGMDDEIHVSEVDRDIDVLLLGYAYPSRQKFLRDILPRLRGLRVVLVGDGWDGFPAETHPVQDLDVAVGYLARSKTVICLHRVREDLASGPEEPENVNRGAIEGFCGPRVFMDRIRHRHAFDPGDVVFFDGPEDLAGALRKYLAGDRDPAADVFAEKCRTVYTLRTRVARILNCVRAPRYGAEIP